MKKILFSGIGSHATAIMQAMHVHSVDEIYIVQDLNNTDEFTIKIRTLREEIQSINAGMRNKISIIDIIIDKNNDEEAYKSILKYYLSVRNEAIITNITAGHQIINYLMACAHTVVSSIFRNLNTKIMYNLMDMDKTIEIPFFRFTLNDKILEYLYDLYYVNHHPIIEMRTDKRYKPKYIHGETHYKEIKKDLGASDKLINGYTYTRKKYTRPDMSRLNAQLKKFGYIDLNGDMTKSGIYIGCITEFIALKNSLYKVSQSESESNEK